MTNIQNYRIDKRIIGVLVFVIALVVPVQAKKYAWEYDYKKLVKEANKGDAYSQYCLGETFNEGRLNVTPDKRKAFEWYMKAAKQDLDIAQYKVAMMYFYGQGVAKDDMEFIHWLKACANYAYDTDDKFKANLLLADYLGNGKYGMEKDLRKAIDITKNLKLNYSDMSGRNNFLYAMQYQQLGQLYNNLAADSLLEVDFNQTANAYEEAAKAFEEEAKCWSRWRTETSEEYHKAENNMGEAWKNSAVAWILYSIYSDSEDQSIIDKKIVEALRCSANLGHTGAIYGLGEFYYYGEFGIQQDKKKGLELLLKIADTDSRAAFIVATDYYEYKIYSGCKISCIVN